MSAFFICLQEPMFKKILLLLLLQNLFFKVTATESTDFVESAAQLLFAVKTNQPTATLMELLANANEESLSKQLYKDEIKKAFWLNIYNAYIQIFLKKEAIAYQNRNKFFKAKQITIAGHAISFDFIEHGILRKSKIKISLGYLNKLFPAALERRWRVKELDWRIHFALNCGAKSCPPIAFYSADKIDKQLDLATKVYLSAEIEYNAEKNNLAVPTLMSWFRADFGGKKGIRKIINKLLLIPTNSKPKLTFKDYDWTLKLNNF